MGKAKAPENQEYRTCTLCIADTLSDADISFDEDGVCCYCKLHEKFAERRLRSETTYHEILEGVKIEGRGHQYDSVIGISGGVDSCFVTHLAYESGLRPLVVHFDNGWNSELAAHNIKRLLDRTGFDLHTMVVDWEEFLDLQRAFFFASVVDIEMVTDHAITATMMRLAREHKIKYVLSGSNQATECGMPESWSWRKQDWFNISAIHRKFGSIPLRTFPRYGSIRMLYDRVLGRSLVSIPILDHYPYKKGAAVSLLRERYGWREYGGKHYESLFTKFYQAYVLPKKFGIDKRKAHLSALIRNNEITRQDALMEMNKPLYQPFELAEEKAYVLKKLKFSEAEFDNVMSTKPLPHLAYSSDEFLLRIARRASAIGLKRLLAR